MGPTGVLYLRGYMYRLDDSRRQNRAEDTLILDPQNLQSNISGPDSKIGGSAADAFTGSSPARRGKKSSRRGRNEPRDQQVNIGRPANRAGAGWTEKAVLAAPGTGNYITARGFTTVDQENGKEES